MRPILEADRLCLQVATLMALDNPPQHDSDSMIPPQNHGPHSYVPFMKAPSSIGTFTLTSSSGGQPGSQPGANSSRGTSRSSGEDLAPFSMAGLKDWELDLEALEVWGLTGVFIIQCIKNSSIQYRCCCLGSPEGR